MVRLWLKFVRETASFWMAWCDEIEVELGEE
jgi:hypothetical protein